MKTTTDAQYIQRLVSEGEHVRQDFKFEISDARKIARSLSAFANTEGGRLLVGVKDNGKIAGVRSEEEIYMVEAAARRYCRPEAAIDVHIYKVEGKNVLEVDIAESSEKPVCALDEDGKPWAYVRIHDENILASPVRMDVWKQSRAETDTVMACTQREQHLLHMLKEHGPLSVGQCSRMAQMKRKQTCGLLAGFIRFGLVEEVFLNHSFRFQLKNEE